MTLLRSRQFLGSAMVFLITSIASLILISYMAVAFVLTPFSEISLVVQEFVFPELPILAGLIIIAVLSGISLTWSVVRSLSIPSIPKSQRLQSVAERAERELTPLRHLGLSEIVTPPEPTNEERIEELKERYVRGEIDEAEFERRMERLGARGALTEDDRSGTNAREPRTEREL